MLVAANPLIQVIPGLMIWTLVSFGLTLVILKRYAFGPVQKMIDDRRDRIRQTIEEADSAREEAKSLLAAEKITKKTLTSADQQRLIDEALAEIDFSQLEASRS